MNLFLDVISPIPEFSLIKDNKIILSSKIVGLEEDKLSDYIVQSYKKIDKKVNITKNLKSLIITLGPGSYTSLRVGVSFALGLAFSKNIRIKGLSIGDLLSYQINEENLNCGFYIISANNQKFICYKLVNKDIKYIKLEEKNLNFIDDLSKIDIFYYNKEPLQLSIKNIKQKKFILKKNVSKIFSKIKFKNSEVLKPIYISNNKIFS